MAIERGDGPVAEELAGARLAAIVVPSRQNKRPRTRYGSAGNKDDRFDAYVLAGTLRTDGHRGNRGALTPSRPGRRRQCAASAGTSPRPGCRSSHVEITRRSGPCCPGPRRARNRTYIPAK